MGANLLGEVNNVTIYRILVVYFSIVLNGLSYSNNAKVNNFNGRIEAQNN